MKTYPLIPLLSLTGLLVLSAVAPTHATTYFYQTDAQAAFDGGAGDITSISSSYDADAHILTWATTINNTGSGIADGYWLVVDNGPNPKGIVDQLPIFYFDASQSFDASGNYTGVSPTLTAYGYNGLNANSSFLEPGVGLLSSSSGASWNSSNSLTASGDVSTRSFSFTIDTTSLDSSAYVASQYAAANAAFDSSNWEGAAYDHQIGVWFHPTVSGPTDPTYNANGYLTSFPAEAQGSFDVNDQLATCVPEPSSAWLVVLAGMVLVHRRRAQAYMA